MLRRFFLIFFVFLAAFFLFPPKIQAKCRVTIKAELTTIFSGGFKERFRHPPVIQNWERHFIYVSVANCDQKKGKVGKINFGDSGQWFSCPPKPPGWSAPSCVADHTWRIWPNQGKKNLTITYKVDEINYSRTFPIYNVSFQEINLTNRHLQAVIYGYGLEGYSFASRSPYSFFRVEFNSLSAWQRFKNHQAEIRLRINNRYYPLVFCGKVGRYCLFYPSDQPRPARWARGNKVIIEFKNAPSMAQGESFWMKLGVFKFFPTTTLVVKGW